MGKLRMPDGRKLFGANIIPKPTDVAPDPQLAWVRMFQNWDWNGWVKPQIDYACGNGIGCNFITMLGSQEGVALGYFPQSYQDDKVEQIVDYCNSLGVHVLVAGGGPQSPLISAILTSTVTVSQLAGIETATINRISKYPNVVGYGMIQESTASGINTFLANLSTEVRQRTGGVLPLTCSANCVNTAFDTPTPGPTGEDWLLNTSFGRMAQYFDFIAVNIYFRTLDSSWFNQFLTAFPQHDIIINECGRPLSATPAQQASDYDQYMRMANATDPRVRGVLLWAISDQQTITGERWGFYSDAFQPRSWMHDVMRRYTFGSVARNNGARR